MSDTTRILSSKNRLLKGENALSNLRSPTHYILEWERRAQIPDYIAPVSEKETRKNREDQLQQYLIGPTNHPLLEATKLAHVVPTWINSTNTFGGKIFRGGRRGVRCVFLGNLVGLTILAPFDPVTPTIRRMNLPRE